MTDEAGTMGERAASLKGKTMFISGGSRGIGLAIAIRAAKDGANVIIAAKTAEPHPKLPGTIYTAADEIRAAGGEALAVVCDIRSEEQVEEAVRTGVAKFGGIDICVNNASAISLEPTTRTTMRRFDLMQQVNTRGTFLVSKTCVPHLEKSDNPHILNMSPPLNMEEKWFAPHVAYSIAKYGMSLCVLGMAGEFREKGIAVNALWPRTTIATAAVRNLLGGDEIVRRSRKPEILADAAHIILTKPSREFTGNFCIDDEILERAGVTDLGRYAVDPSAKLVPDFFVEPRK
jgi:citronellol/citronellal dehydrogenase